MKNEIDLELLRAEYLAANLIEELGICSPDHIRIRDIAFKMKAMVIERYLSRAAASIVKVGDYATIRISPSDTPERKRFSIAHELGHLIMDHVESIQKVCSDQDMMSWYNNDKETQANFFASELLLPKKLVEKRCDVSKANFKPIIQIAKDFRTSLTATAIKFVRLCPEKCAVVLSSQGKIVWSYRSEEWWPFIPRGKKLDKRTLAYDFFAGEQMAEEPMEVDADAWLENSNIDEIVEDSIASNQYGFVLSILWIRPD